MAYLPLYLSFLYPPIFWGNRRCADDIKDFEREQDCTPYCSIPIFGATSNRSEEFNVEYLCFCATGHSVAATLSAGHYTIWADRNLEYPVGNTALVPVERNLFLCQPLVVAPPLVF